ncbi:glycosyltransferase [Candidatus Woesearchaeota archaeon]|nr:glycosyltransferase [Candidatus Woesearchaeota archaeon]
MAKFKPKGIKFMVLGDGEYLRNKKNELLKEGIIITGLLSPREVEEHYSSADLLYFKLQYEWGEYCLALVEAMKCKLPILTDYSNVHTEIFGKERAFLIEKDTPPKNIIQKIIEIKENPKELDLKKNLAYNYAINNFSKEKVINDLIEVINKVN